MYGYPSQKGGVEGHSRFWWSTGRVRMWLRMWGLGVANQVVVSGRRVWRAWIGMVTLPWGCITRCIT